MRRKFEWFLIGLGFLGLAALVFVAADMEDTVVARVSVIAVGHWDGRSCTLLTADMETGRVASSQLRDPILCSEIRPRYILREYGARGRFTGWLYSRQSK